MSDEGDFDVAGGPEPIGALPPTPDFQSFVDYQLRNSLFRAAQRTCLEQLAKQPGNVAAKFWRAFAMQQEGAFNESIRELLPLQNYPELALAVTASLITAYSRNDAKDKETIAKLKEDLKRFSSNSEESALVFAGRYFWHADKEKQAKQCIEKALTKNKRNIEALVILGYLMFSNSSGRNERRALQFFDTALKFTGDKKDLSALLGRALFHERKQKWERALEDINQVIVLVPEFPSAITEKAKLLMLRGDWEEALSTAQRVLQKEPQDVQALKIQILYSLTREAKVETVKSRLNDLLDALEKNEPRNHRLLFELAQLCARLANRRRLILNQTLILLEKALKLAPPSPALRSDYLSEQGYQLTLLEDYSSAANSFADALKEFDGNIHALYGSIKVKILQGKHAEASEELKFISEIQSAVGNTAELVFLHALLAVHQENPEKLMGFLNETMELHTKSLEVLPFGIEYFIAYNPEFVLELIQQFSSQIGTEPRQLGDVQNPVLGNCISLLKTLTNLVPGMVQAQLLLSKAYFIQGDFLDAESTIALCLQLDPQCAAAHIIQAQIFLAREHFKQCSQALEQARSLDFEIRNTPVYHLMKAKLLEASGQLEDALKVLHSAIELPGVKNALTSNSSRKPGVSAVAPVPLQDRISIFLELSSVFIKLSKIPEAKKILADARVQFKDTREIARITISEADLLIKLKEFDSALQILRSIAPDSQYFTRSKIRQADIFLQHKRQKKFYIASYQEIADYMNSVYGFILLGDAFLRISEPEKAIREFERALKKEPNHPQLSSKIGKALITTHDYARAVRYYEAATMADNGKLFLYHELAELYIALKQHEEALRVLERAIDVSKAQQANDSQALQPLLDDVKSYLLISDVYSQVTQNAGEQIIIALTKAWELQGEILTRVRTESSEIKKAQKEIAAQLCFRLAEYQKSHNSPEKALLYYNEALKHNENHEKARLALARLHLIQNELDACQNACLAILRLDSGNKEASIMLADIMFRKNDPEAATFHFQQLLEKNPNRYEALIKLIQLLRRAGKLVDVPKYIKMAEKTSPAAQFSPGLHFARGLYAYYSNDPRSALIQFNYARKDAEWGRESIMNMIEIYLNPDNSELFNELQEIKGDFNESVGAAEKLLQELTKLGENSAKYKVLEAYTLMASKSKPRIEKALTDLLTLLELDGNFVPALLGCAIAFDLLSQPTKAKNQLKRISKLAYNSEFPWEFEKAWLMLANVYIGVGKYDLATELCKKALQFNKSSAKAWEMLGLIMEKESAWADAADDYENAWRFLNENSPTIGYKLAFNYLKARRYVEAIEVCLKVLQHFPDYPKIRKEILEKARACLRP